MVILHEIIMDSIFVGLKDTSQLAAHLLKLDRSVHGLRQFASARGLSTTTKRLHVVFSLAEMRIFDPIALTINVLLKTVWVP